MKEIKCTLGVLPWDYLYRYAPNLWKSFLYLVGIPRPPPAKKKKKNKQN